MKAKDRIIAALAGSGLADNLGDLVGFLERAVDAERQVIELSARVMDKNEYYRRKLACYYVDQLIFKLKGPAGQ